MTTIHITAFLREARLRVPKCANNPPVDWAELLRRHPQITEDVAREQFRRACERFFVERWGSGRSQAGYSIEYASREGRCVLWGEVLREIEGCPECWGTGGTQADGGDPEPCVSCGGTGKRWARSATEPKGGGD